MKEIKQVDELSIRAFSGHTAMEGIGSVSVPARKAV